MTDYSEANTIPFERLKELVEKDPQLRHKLTSTDGEFFADYYLHTTLADAHEKFPEILRDFFPPR